MTASFLRLTREEREFFMNRLPMPATALTSLRSLCLRDSAAPCSWCAPPPPRPSSKSKLIQEMSATEHDLPISMEEL